MSIAVGKGHQGADRPFRRSARNGVRRLLRIPLRSLFDSRDDAALAARLANEQVVDLQAQVGARTEEVARLQEVHERSSALLAEHEVAQERSDALARIDVSEHNAGGVRPKFSELVSQACTADQFVDPAFLRWVPLLRLWPVEASARLQNLNVGPSPAHHGSLFLHSKIWEWAFILQAADQHGVLRSGRRAIGFGVGTEMIPAALASYGIEVVATDQGVDGETANEWMAADYHVNTLEYLYRPELVKNEELRRLVSVRAVDMNHIPDDLGTCDFLWSSCALEHLGSPELGLDFVMSSARLLRPGGIAVHTTELELTPRDTTADYGHMAVYRIPDLQGLAERLTDSGYDMSCNFSVPLDTPADRYVHLLRPETHTNELWSLKTAMGDSVTTSFGLVIRRPPR